jgi:hypothetical protein
MPRITQYTREAVDTGQLNVRADARAFGGDQRGLEAMAQAANTQAQNAANLGQKLEGYYERKVGLDYTKKLSEFQLNLTKRQQELSTTDLGDDADITETYRADYEKMAKEFESQVPVFMRQKFAEDSLQLQNRFVNAGFEDETKRSGLRAANAYNDIVTQGINAVSLDPSSRDLVIKNIEGAASYLNISPEERQKVMSETMDKVNGAYAEQIATTSPDSFIRAAKNGEFNFVPDVSRYIKYAENQQELNAAKAQKAYLKSLESADEVKIQNQINFSDIIADDNVPVEEKIRQLNKLDFEGQISDDYATEARRYMKSLEEVTAQTNAAVMADIVTRVYDLNAIVDENPKGYLEGISTIRKDILSRRASGELSASDEKKINNQLKTLTSSKLSEATKSVSISFGEGRKIIQSSVPVDMQGEALRQLFYSTEGVRESLEGDKEASKKLKEIYKTKAREITDKINAQKKDAVMQSVNSTPKDPASYLKSLGFSDDDIKTTIAQTGLSVTDIAIRKGYK